MAQTIEGFVGTSLDDARMSPIHWRVFALISAGYFFDVCDYVILGALIPDMVRSGFATPGQVATVASATLFGLFIGTLGQGEFTDRFGRKTVYQFNLLLYGLATIAAAFSPNYIWLAALRFIAGIGLGAEQPLCFAYAGEYAPKKIRGRFIAGVQMIGGAWSWPLSTLFALAFRDTLGWRGIWIVIGVCALIVFLFRFSLPELPRWLAIHGQGDRAIELLRRMGIAGPREPLATDAASNTHSDPIAVVFRLYRGRVIAGMVCFVAFFGVALGLGTWLPNMMADRGMTITKSLTYTFGMTLAFPCASLFMMYSLDDIRPEAHLDRVVPARRRVRRGFRQCHQRHHAAGRRLRHDLLHPARRQFDADLCLRGIPHERARLWLRHRAGSRPPRHRIHHPGDPVDSDQLRYRRGVRLGCHRAGDRRLHRQAARSGVARRGARRAGAADRLTVQAGIRTGSAAMPWMKLE